MNDLLMIVAVTLATPLIAALIVAITSVLEPRAAAATEDAALRDRARAL